MLKERAKLIAATVLAVELGCVAAAFLAAYAVRSSLMPRLGLASTPLYPLASYLPLLPLALAIYALALGAGSFRSYRIISLPSELARLTGRLLVATLVFVVLIYLGRLDERLLEEGQFSRFWILLFATLSLFFILLHRTGLRLTAHYLRSRGYNYRVVLIVGSAWSAIEAAKSIERHRAWGYKLLGFVNLEPEPAEPAAIAPILGTLEDLPAILDREVVDDVLITVPQADLGEMEDLLVDLEERGICTRILLDLFPKTQARLEIGDLDGLPLLTFSTAPTNPVLLAVKRLIDIFVSALLLAVCLPLLAVLALLIKLTSPGPVIFGQTRCGLNGRHFKLFKLRTMIVGAEGRRTEVSHLNQMRGPTFKAERDPRVTPVGRFLRRFSLDELPQLWNVLKGDMSLVGPRPPIPEEVRQYERWQRRRLSMKPGLTCLWQVGGRAEVDFDDWMKLDLLYIDTWSPFLDLKILLKTIPAVLGGRGAF